MRLTRIPLVAVVLLMLACGDTPITDVPDPSFNYMNNPQTGPVVFTTGIGSPAAWSTDPENGLGVLWGITFKDFCKGNFTPKGDGHWTQTPSGSQYRWMEDDVNLTVLPLVAPGFPDPEASPFSAPDVVCKAQPLYVGHGFMRMTMHQAPSMYFEIFHFNLHGDVDDEDGNTYKLRYELNYRCSAADDCDLKKRDLDIR
jgi:hypothetical protein